MTSKYICTSANSGLSSVSCVCNWAVAAHELVLLPSLPARPPDESLSEPADQLGEQLALAVALAPEPAVMPLLYKEQQRLPTNANCAKGILKLCPAHDQLCSSPNFMQCSLHDLVHNAGEYRKREAYGGFAEGIFFYQPALLIPSLLLTVCDLYNQSLRDIADSANQVPALYHLAAVLFVQLVTVHPFSDGNGKLARLLASHVLRSVTPFPITPFADGTDLTRKVYVGAIVAARAVDGKANSFLTMSAPADFSALLIHAGWESWKSCFKNLER